MHTETLLLQLIWAASAGIFAQFISDKIKQPSIFLLLIAGLAMGPHGLHILNPDIFRAGLPLLVEASVIIILFEGALSLKIENFLHTSLVIRRLISIGAALMMIGSSLAVHFFLGAGWGLSFIFGALISITGPTVIQPIIKRVKLKKSVATPLAWEAIILDPVGAIVAVVILEIILTHSNFFLFPLLNLPMRFAVGIAAGLACGFLGTRFLRIEKLTTIDIRTNLALVLSLFCYGFAEKLYPHSGLVAIVVLGIFLGNSQIPSLELIREFKGTLTTFLLSLVFVLLISNLNLDAIFGLGFNGFYVVLGIIFILRPLCIWASTRGSTLTFKEKLFLSWMAPKGIVAASVASLFTLELAAQNYPGAEKLEALVYLAIATTVTLQGLTAGILATLLGVREVNKKGFLFIGAHPFAQGIAKWLQDKGVDVKMIDTDSHDVNQARALGLDAFKGSILDESFLSHIDLSNMGNLIALTSNDEINALSCQFGTSLFDETHCYRLKEPTESSSFLTHTGGTPVFSELPLRTTLLHHFDSGKYQFKAFPLQTPISATEQITVFENKKAWPLFREQSQDIIPIKSGDVLKAGENILALIECDSTVATSQ